MRQHWRLLCFHSESGSRCQLERGGQNELRGGEATGEHDRITNTTHGLTVTALGSDDRKPQSRKISSPFQRWYVSRLFDLYQLVCMVL
jgi:hypothetical protein